MKKIFIIYPHWAPSNLAGVHRPRLVANYLKENGWQPILLTVLPDYYEETLDPDIWKTVSKDIEVHAVKAKRTTKPRIIGDIGLRAWPYLKRKALEIIENEKPDFLWIPIPSFYMALLGRRLHDKTGIPYGIDYIDPWVRDISNRKDLRSKLSILAARALEPFAVKKAALISGVNENYYLPVYERNFPDGGPPHIAFPYGFDPNDHSIKLDKIEFPWQDIAQVKPLVYAGAFLPNSHLFIRALFAAVNELKKQDSWSSEYKMFFLGTGNYRGKSIEDYAREYNVEQEVIEIRDRFPFLHILNFLSVAHAVMVIGSTEKHYTASKTFQSLLSNRPVFSIFHEESSAVKFLEGASADNYLVKYKETSSEADLTLQIINRMSKLVERRENKWAPKLEALDQFSSKRNAALFAEKLDNIIEGLKVSNGY